MTIKFIGELEIDIERGVIYFHDTERTGATLLRIQGLPTPVPKPGAGAALDIQADAAHVSWRGEPSRPSEKGKRRQHPCHDELCLMREQHPCHDLCFQP